MCYSLRYQDLNETQSHITEITEITYAADHCSKSAGCVRMADLVNSLRMSGSWGGMLICCAQYIVSDRGMAAIQSNRM